MQPPSVCPGGLKTDENKWPNLRESASRARTQHANVSLCACELHTNKMLPLCSLHGGRYLQSLHHVRHVVHLIGRDVASRKQRTSIAVRSNTVLGEVHPTAGKEATAYHPHEHLAALPTVPQTCSPPASGPPGKHTALCLRIGILN